MVKAKSRHVHVNKTEKKTSTAAVTLLVEELILLLDFKARK